MIYVNENSVLFQFMALVISTLLDLVKNLRAFAGILLVCCSSRLVVSLYSMIWGTFSKFDCAGKKMHPQPAHHDYKRNMISFFSLLK